MWIEKRQAVVVNTAEQRSDLEGSRFSSEILSSVLMAGDKGTRPLPHGAPSNLRRPDGNPRFLPSSNTVAMRSSPPPSESHLTGALSAFTPAPAAGSAARATDRKEMSVEASKVPFECF
ncbi:unnamed protein product [Rangifer tarandus platyrhynchus]|uniref:Uncharacterized protein n=1 Tax=Rangifer tarandus platyrhynchus TaxID=3082113 RepID=A0ABN8Z7J8_RANTA|nr:unnamed protein product [Rangifer tarandus platyrhynchus]